MKFRVNPKRKWQHLPMIKTHAIAKINERHITAMQQSIGPTCPHFLWAKLWITMFTSCPGRASAGLVQGAFEMTINQWEGT